MRIEQEDGETGRVRETAPNYAASDAGPVGGIKLFPSSRLPVDFFSVFENRARSF
jgi:hypothetical protein